jgi:hypothetical protein
MMTKRVLDRKEIFLDKVKKIKDKKGKLSLIALVVEFPNKAKVIIADTEQLDEKVQYIISAYDEDMKLKNNQVIIADYIIL